MVRSFLFALSLVVALAFSACGSVCTGTSCACPSGQTCTFDTCNAQTQSCNFDCASDSTCTGTCGASCRVTCAGKACTVSAGAGSNVACTAGTCTITCNGACSVASTATLTLTCNGSTKGTAGCE